MADDIQTAPTTPTPHRPEQHAMPANPEAHLLEAHNMSIQVQGKEGPTGQSVWALVRDNRGKVQTLAVFRGTQREAVLHFYGYIHPAKPAPVAAPARRSYPPRQNSRPGGPPAGRGGPRR
jgi:hypothetical protein